MISAPYVGVNVGFEDRKLEFRPITERPNPHKDSIKYDAVYSLYSPRGDKLNTSWPEWECITRSNMAIGLVNGYVQVEKSRDLYLSMESIHAFVRVYLSHGFQVKGIRTIQGAVIRLDHLSAIMRKAKHRRAKLEKWDTKHPFTDQEKLVYSKNLSTKSLARAKNYKRLHGHMSDTGLSDLKEEA